MSRLYPETVKDLIDLVNAEMAADPAGPEWSYRLNFGQPNDLRLHVVLCAALEGRQVVTQFRLKVGYDARIDANEDFHRRGYDGPDDNRARIKFVLDEQRRHLGLRPPQTAPQ